MVVVTEHETGLGATELIEQVCAAASPVTRTTHAAAVRMVLIIARDDDIMTASGHSLQRGPTEARDCFPVCPSPKCRGYATAT